MTIIARLQHMNHGNHFRAYSLRCGKAAAPIDPFLEEIPNDIRKI